MIVSAVGRPCVRDYMHGSHKGYDGKCMMPPLPVATCALIAPSIATSGNALVIVLIEMTDCMEDLHDFYPPFSNAFTRSFDYKSMQCCLHYNSPVIGSRTVKTL